MVREEIQNPVRNPVKFKPKTIVSKATDFQVFFNDQNGNRVNNVTVGSDNQSKVHTAEVYITVRSPNELLKNPISTDAKNYLKRRRLTLEEVKKFKIGFETNDINFQDEIFKKFKV